MESEQTLTLIFSKEEWNKLVSSYQAPASDGRRKLNKQFDFEINDRLKKQSGLSCWLNSKYNYFRKTTSIRSTSPYWRGVFGCKNEECTIKFICTVQDANAEVGLVRMTVYWQGKSQHVDCGKKRQCRGEERKQMSMQAMADGVSKTQTANVLHNFDAGKQGQWMVNLSRRDLCYSKADYSFGFWRKARVR